MKKILFALAIFVAHTCMAKSFVVNSLLDTQDANPGDGICDDGSGNCTFRAAIQEDARSFCADTIMIAITGTTFPTTAYQKIETDSLVIISTTDNFIIDGRKRSDGGYGIFITADHCYFDRIFVTGFRGENVHLEHANYNTFYRIVSTNSRAKGGGGLEVSHSSHNQFIECLFSYSSIGIRLIDQSNYNVVKDSKSIGNSHSGMTSFSSISNQFIGNFLNSNDNGMYLIQADSTVIDSVIILNSTAAGVNVFGPRGFGNTIRSTNIDSVRDGPGIVFDQYTGGGSVVCCDIRNCRFGVIISNIAGPVSIQKNTIADSPTAIQLINHSDGARVIQNTMIRCPYSIQTDPSVMYKHHVIKKNIQR